MKNNKKQGLTRVVRRTKKCQKKQATWPQFLTALGLLLLLMLCLIRGQEQEKPGHARAGQKTSGLERQKLVKTTVEKKKTRAKRGKVQVQAKKKKKVKKNKKQPYNPYDIDHQTVKVLITDTNMASIFHSQVVISGTDSMVVEGGKKGGTYQAGKKLKLTAKAIKKAGKMITVSSPGGGVTLHTITRQGVAPVYPFTLRLCWDKKGILVINELPVEEYLCRVLPSEMPLSYPLEALKAQAVCARSFTYRQIQEKSYEQYGADLDDTSAFQVYNMIGDDEKARKAVQETSGRMVFHEDDVIMTYYYSTSWGCSATPAEVWGAKEELYPVLLQSRLGTMHNRAVDLSQEGSFYQFMTHDYYDIYDEDSDWYRWSTSISAEELGARLGIGTVKRVEVLERGESGLLQKIRVVGKQGRKTIDGQQQIRQLFFIPGMSIQKQDGEKVTSMTILPSAAFYLTKEKKKKKCSFAIRGGGLGHGVGFSQNGASEMAKDGLKYPKILKYYYPDCQVG